MEFICHKCRNKIIVNHLKPGEIAQCKGCAAYNIVPDKEGVVAEPGAFNQDKRLSEELTEDEKKALFNSWWVPLMYCLTYVILSTYLISEIEQNGLFGLFPIFDFGRTFKIIFLFIPGILTIVGLGVFEIYFSVSVIRSINPIKIFSAFSRYPNRRVTLMPFFAIIFVFILALIKEL